MVLSSTCHLILNSTSIYTAASFVYEHNYLDGVSVICMKCMFFKPEKCTSMPISMNLLLFQCVLRLKGYIKTVAFYSIFEENNYFVFSPSFFILIIINIH